MRRQESRRCVSCGRPIVVGAERMECAMEHPGTTAAGWLKWGAKKFLGRWWPF